MKSIFVIGDSISMQYGPYLEEMLAGRFGYGRLRTRDREQGSVSRNAGDSRTTLESLRDELMSGLATDCLLINCGLHDIKTESPGGDRQVSLEEYRKNIEEIASLLSARAFTPLWVTTTPVNDALHAAKKPFLRFDADVVAYNAVASEIMRKKGIAIADLYQMTGTLGDGIWEDGVHFTERVRMLQATFLAGYVDALENNRG